MAEENVPGEKTLSAQHAKLGGTTMEANKERNRRWIWDEKTESLVELAPKVQENVSSSVKIEVSDRPILYTGQYL